MNTIASSDPNAVSLPQVLIPAAPAETPALVQTELSDNYHEAYRMRLQGVAVGEIAARFGKDRATIWRWAKAVER